MKGGSFVGLMFVLSDNDFVQTVASYNPVYDRYQVESSNGRDKAWLPGRTIVANLAASRFRLVYPIWAPLFRPLDSISGDMALPSQAEIWPAAC
jgi:hypothetical protein